VENVAKFSPHLRRAVSALVLFLVVEYLVLPQIAGARHSLHLIADIRFRYVFVGLALEAAAIVAYAQLFRAILPKGQTPSLWIVTRIQLATLAVSHVVPGGAAAGGGLGYRLLTSEGVDGTDAAFILATASIGSAVVLNVLLWIGLIVSIPLRGYNPLYLTASLVGLALIGVFSLAVVALTRGEERAARTLRRLAQRIPFLDEDRLDRLVRRTAARLRAIGSDRALLFRLVGWAAANWIFDMTALGVFLLAFGHHPAIDGLLVSYGIANVLAAIPITPGGLGVTEAVLTASLVGFGAARGQAVLGVITWRLVQFWIPIPLGAGAYLSLHLEPKGKRADELRRVAEHAAREAEDLKTWSEKHAVKLPHRNHE
jgi:uncharacterized protein (TIRG00374 family)